MTGLDTILVMGTGRKVFHEGGLGRGKDGCKLDSAARQTYTLLRLELFQTSRSRIAGRLERLKRQAALHSTRQGGSCKR